MTTDIPSLTVMKDALSQVASKTDELAKLQLNAREMTIQTIHDMCDTLQLASDVLSREISSSIVEFNSLRDNPNGEALIGFFERMALKFSEGNLRLILHEGKICGKLHKLSDRFRQPISDQSRGGLSIWDEVRTFFFRSNCMFTAVDALRGGEIEYVRDFGRFLDEVRNQAEAATGIRSDVVQLGQAGEQLIILMRDKRQVLQQMLLEIKKEADACIGKLH